MIKCVLTIAIFLSAIYGYAQTFERRQEIVIMTDSGSYWLSDTASSEWTFPKMNDTLAALKSLLNSYKHNMLVQSIFFKQRDSDTKKAYQTATHWANVCKWICEEQGISQTAFLSMLRRKGYSTINLYNKKPPRKRKA